MDDRITPLLGFSIREEAKLMSAYGLLILIDGSKVSFDPSNHFNLSITSTYSLEQIIEQLADHHLWESKLQGVLQHFGNSEAEMRPSTEFFLSKVENATPLTRQLLYGLYDPFVGEKKTSPQINPTPIHSVILHRSDGVLQNCVKNIQYIKSHKDNWIEYIKGVLLNNNVYYKSSKNNMAKFTSLNKQGYSTSMADRYSSSDEPYYSLHGMLLTLSLSLFPAYPKIKNGKYCLAQIGSHTPTIFRLPIITKPVSSIEVTQLSKLIGCLPIKQINKYNAFLTKHNIGAIFELTLKMADKQRRKIQKVERIF